MPHGLYGTALIVKKSGLQNSLMRLSCLVGLLVVACLAQLASARIIIRGSERFASSPAETVTAAFTTPDAALTIVQYGGLSCSWGIRLNHPVDGTPHRADSQ